MWRTRRCGQVAVLRARVWQTPARSRARTRCRSHCRARAGPALRLDVQSRARRPWTDVITEWEPTLPALRHRWPGHGLEEAPRVPVAHRDDGNLGDVERIL